MSTVGRWVLCGALGVASMMQVISAEAMPVAGMSAQRSDVIDAQVVCDGRGCFTFGPRQSYTPPSYRPPDYRGPTYYRPRGVVVQPFVYRPPAPNPAPLAQVPAASINRHKQWCQDRYKSYSSVTNLYKTHSGHSQPCESPYQ
ncbi:BA14K family protein [Rhizobium tubonense]|uniref:Lectin-like protein BA14k n=1 Tax=Rhizobium tubonense TaxID=484088 RepID=A0A2W4CGT8_9HYPH|nr:BA14K family protein [Rhizobium tubonense]PZM12297.1 hypothetical protein CPY51_19625 [Rhizobium tubonense]